MSPEESPPPRPSPSRLAWLLPPFTVLVALAAAIGANIWWQGGTLGRPPETPDLAPVATGTHPLAPLARSTDGDWCALVTSGSQEPALQSYFVRRGPGAEIHVDATLVNRTGAEWLADAIGALELRAQGRIVSESETRTVGGRAFECRTIVLDLPARGEQPARRTTLWVSPDVKSLGVVAARVELVGVRRDVLEWELGGSGVQGSSGPVAEWGTSPVELARSLTARPKVR